MQNYFHRLSSSTPIHVYNMLLLLCFYFDRDERRLWLGTLMGGCACVYATRMVMPLSIVAISKEQGWSKTDSVCVFMLINVMVLPYKYQINVCLSLHSIVIFSEKMTTCVYQLKLSSIASVPIIMITEIILKIVSPCQENVTQMIQSCMLYHNV